MITLTVNGQSHTVDVDPDTPLLWVLRDTLGLTGTKYGCGISECGICSVHMNGELINSCQKSIKRCKPLYLRGVFVFFIENFPAQPLGVSAGNFHPPKKNP